jgi:choline-sulfatase
MKKPNILWIMTDEQRPDSLGCYGSAWARTPNIDRIAKRGTVMHNAVCQSPVCLPSRSSQLAALYPQEFACMNNILAETGYCFSESVKCFPEIFTDHGYESLNFGRYHNLFAKAFQINMTMNDYMDEYCNHFGLNEKYDEAQYHVIKRPGKNYERPLILAGTYPGETNPNRISTDRALAYLDSRDKGKPFLMRVSYNAPHTPMLTPMPFDTLYDPDEIPIRYYNEKARKCRALFDQSYADSHEMNLLSREQIRQMWKDYMGLCAYIDSLVGELLQGLERHGILEDTIIVYSCDHGKSLGEWGSGEKGTYDREVWRVPFIWSWPGHIPEGKVDTDPCEIIDTARTLLTLAGLSESIIPSYRGRFLFDAGEKSGSYAAFGATRWHSYSKTAYPQNCIRVAVLYNNCRMDMNWQTDGQPIPEALMDGNLFDWNTDPYELTNVFTDFSYRAVRLKLMNKLSEWINSVGMDERLKNPENAGVLF